MGAAAGHSTEVSELEDDAEMLSPGGVSLHRN